MEFGCPNFLCQSSHVFGKALQAKDYEKETRAKIIEALNLYALFLLSYLPNRFLRLCLKQDTSSKLNRNGVGIEEQFTQLGFSAGR